MRKMGRKKFLRWFLHKLRFKYDRSLIFSDCDVHAPYCSQKRKLVPNIYYICPMALIFAKFIKIRRNFHCNLPYYCGSVIMSRIFDVQIWKWFGIIGLPKMHYIYPVMKTFAKLIKIGKILIYWLPQSITGYVF